MATLHDRAAGYFHELLPSSLRSLHVLSEADELLLRFLTYALIITLQVSIFESILRLLKTPTLSACKLSQGPTRDPTCSHCWDDIKATDTTLVHNTCNNSWHQNRLAAVAKASDMGPVLCPLCRSSINEAEKPLHENTRQDTRSNDYSRSSVQQDFQVYSGSHDLCPVHPLALSISSVAESFDFRMRADRPYQSGCCVWETIVCV